jgi:hypothetical protein
MGLTLALLVPGIGANDIHASFAAHHLAMLANLFDACSYLHQTNSLKISGSKAV